MNTLTQEIPVFENTGLIELEKAWAKYSHADTDILIRLAEENFENKIYAVSLFLVDKILKEKKPDAQAVTRLRFIRAESFFEFKFYRQAYPDYIFYVKEKGETEALHTKMRFAKRMIHTGNIGTLLFLAVTILSLDIMFFLLYYVQFIQVGNSIPFEMGLNLNYIYYSAIAGGAMLLFGLFYRYVIIARMKI